MPRACEREPVPHLALPDGHLLPTGNAAVPPRRTWAAGAVGAEITPQPLAAGFKLDSKLLSHKGLVYTRSWARREARR